MNKRLAIAESVSDADIGDLTAVYRRHAAAVSRWARRLAGPGHEIEDIVHDVFVVAMRRASAFDPELGEVGAWLHGITVKVVQSHRRRQRMRHWLALVPLAGADLHGREAAARAIDPEAAAFSSEAMRRVYRALDRLPEKYRTAFILHDIDELPGEEIAQVTGVRVSNVWVRVHRARKLLAALIEGGPERKAS